jgi:hypothetical protein
VKQELSNGEDTVGNQSWCRKIVSKEKQSCPATRPGGACGGVEVQLLLVLGLGTRRGEWSTSRPGRALPPIPIGQEAG